MIAISDTGNQRKINEDYYGLYENENLALLCDGMGGHNAGLRASELAVSTIYHFYKTLERHEYQEITQDLRPDYPDIAHRLVCAVRLANRHIHQTQLDNETLKGMGTTIASLAFQDNVACLGHVGDSRIYRYRDHELICLTQDHSLLNELIQDQEIRAEDAYKFKQKNVITRALGLNDTVKIDVRIDEVHRDDLYLLCSDGLVGGVSDADIQKILERNHFDLMYVANALLNQSLVTDGSDNITILLIRVDDIDYGPTCSYYPSGTINCDDETTRRNIELLLKNHGYKTYRRNIFDNRSRKLREKPWFKFGVSGFALLLLICVLTHDFGKGVATVDEAEHTNVTFSEASSGPEGTKMSQPHGDAKTFMILPQDSIEGTTSANVVDKRVQNSPDKTRSLSNVRHNQGVLYLVGFQKMKQHETFYVELNDHKIGKLTRYLENGIKLKPGRHVIAVRDKNGILIHSQTIWISAGDIKAIEAK